MYDRSVNEEYHMDKKRVLIVDDDSEIRQIVKVLLEGEGFQIEEASCGNEAFDKMAEEIDLIILDVMMPGMNGYQVCQNIRKKSTVPILFLTAKTKEQDLVEGFQSGGDDYLEKPFSFLELVARVKALLRRNEMILKSTGNGKVDFICIKDFIVDKEFGTVTKNEAPIFLTYTEYQILILLAETRGKIFSLKEIYENVWGEAFFSFSSNTVMVHIRNLREKIEDNANEPVYIKNAWGKGYYIE